MNKNVFSIPDTNMVELTEKLTHLQKRASKLHTTPISWRITGQEIKKVRDALHNVIDMVHHVIEVQGDIPVLNGWRFVASIDHVSTEDGNIISSIPNGLSDSTLATYRQAMPICEHCLKNRQRNNTYLLENVKTGAIKQVGKTCLKDFTRTDDPLEIAEYMQVYYDTLLSCSIAQDEYSSNGKREYASLETYLNHVAASIRLNGWVSTTKARDYPDMYPTKYAALDSLLPRRQEDILPVSIEDKARTVQALQWIRSLSDTSDAQTQFMYNLYIVCKSPVLAIKHAGIAAALFVAYDKAMQVEYERKQLRESIYLGQIGDKITCTVLVTRETPCEGAYGVTYLYSMIVEYTGSSVKWFASKQCLKVGKRYQLTGIVKTHEEYKGVKQTVFTRCKAIELP